MAASHNTSATSAMTSSNHSRSIGGGYMDVDDIIMTSGKIPCQFKVRVPDLGYLNPSSSKADIDEGDDFDVPLWLARNLYSSPTCRYVTVEYTKPYKANNRAILEADATVVDLNHCNPFFYKFGCGLLHFVHKDAVELSRILLGTFVSRLSSLMDLSRHNVHNVIATPTNGVIKRKNMLNATEQRLFHLGQNSLLSYNKWCQGRSRKLETSSLVERHKRRKLAN